ncbi:MAG: hypothetical protein HY074_14870 [Deltaproteobacteria bacterium]|nr:hypothetical protein [Deltaproteobacteria bacterium]
MLFSCAGKVFITGEYTCIQGGPALLGTVDPLFQLEAVRDAATSSRHASPFAAQSPAGLYLAANSDALTDVRLTWTDPYDTPIGVGSSSAQFILSVATVHALRGNPMPAAEKVLALYWSIVGDTQGLRPSGADIVAQWLGGPVVVCNEPFLAGKLDSWTGDAQFILAYTGRKAKTHEHLLQLRARGFPHEFAPAFNQLNEITLGAIDAWKAQDAGKLGAALRLFQAALARGGLAPAEFTAELDPIQNWPGVLGCKGSGAQGGDCVLLLVATNAVSRVCDELKNRSWKPIVANWTSNELGGPAGWNLSGSRKS